MFEWLFKKKKDIIENLLDKIIENGITININMSGDINVKERRNSLGTEEFGLNVGSIEIEETSEGTPKDTTKKEIINSIPNFQKLEGPKVGFGEEKET